MKPFVDYKHTDPNDVYTPIVLQEETIPADKFTGNEKFAWQVKIHDHNKPGSWYIVWWFAVYEDTNHQKQINWGEQAEVMGKFKIALNKYE